MDKKTSEELMDMLGLNETLNKLAKTNGVRWYGDDDDVLREHSLQIIITIIQSSSPLLI